MIVLENQQLVLEYVHLISINDILTYSVMNNYKF